MTNMVILAPLVLLVVKVPSVLSVTDKMKKVLFYFNLCR